MMRTTVGIALGAAFGALSIGPVREHVQDQLWHPTEAVSVGIVVMIALWFVPTMLWLGKRA